MRWTSIWEGPGEAAAQPGDRDLLELARTARLEMEAAKAQFEEVRDPDLVDYAIYRLQAAERHFVYLLREARG